MRVSDCPLCHRRNFLKTALAGSAAFFTVPGAFAEALMLTAPQTEGPFYPDRLPLDTDNDLLILNASLTPAVGEVTHLTGVVMDLKGQPVRNALVEIWSADNHGIYLHTKADHPENRDKNFQGYGRFLTGTKGEYYFRTIKPGQYPGRTRHIHVAVSLKGKRVLTTQCYPAGEPGQEKDGVIQSIRDPQALKTVIVPFKPLEGSKTGELAARFDIVLGLTPDDGHP
ncbi:intradiol ring-cleavage dioxygenase [Luteolibacter ambystomatis]|uniref:Intradiol ring-cleavage dioxygenase n=1 Tax=Luteolibacter ambystomatis TaxID=2824561 RepID=A0A975J1V6_9BACT|nr:protocatechuate 3,4-dioxygenase [Luteolibacter ambystomatis]QUE52501.1 intradiol ring-cleavage dioxygenase [Luteolibacter ambystomatis]